jgi:hypothetical protein
MNDMLAWSWLLVTIGIGALVLLNRVIGAPQPTSREKVEGSNKPTGSLGYAK